MYAQGDGTKYSAKWYNVLMYVYLNYFSFILTIPILDITPKINKGIQIDIDIGTFSFSPKIPEK